MMAFEERENKNEKNIKTSKTADQSLKKKTNGDSNVSDDTHNIIKLSCIRNVYFEYLSNQLINHNNKIEQRDLP